MKAATLNYEFPDDQEEYEAALRSLELVSAIREIHNEIFRPARKYGYSDERVSSIADIIGVVESAALIGVLEEKFIKILQDHNVDKFL